MRELPKLECECGSRFYAVTYREAKALAAAHLAEWHRVTVDPWQIRPDLTD
jgi:hypothetical protein